ncbi:hypothetical protein L7F22_043317 [Adiantum nelumboides]|nr:hypothetical protein [Adiantum nelumboides]
MWFDGAYRGVIQKAGAVVVIQDPSGKVIFSKGYDLEDVLTNNEVEYLALHLGMRQCVEFGISKIIVKGDAPLVIKQLLGQWQVKRDSLKHWFYSIKKILKFFEAIQFIHIRREENQVADYTFSSISISCLKHRNNGYIHAFHE